MNQPAQPLSAEANALMDAYAALNRNDIAGFVAIFDPRIERVEPPDFPMAGTYHGIDAVTEHVKAGRGTWADGACEPQRFVVAGNKVILFVHVRVRLKNETDWREGDIADVFTFRDGKAIEYRTFGDPKQAFDWAGVNDQP